MDWHYAYDMSVRYPMLIKDATEEDRMVPLDIGRTKSGTIFYWTQLCERNPSLFDESSLHTRSSDNKQPPFFYRRDRFSVANMPIVDFRRVANMRLTEDGYPYMELTRFEMVSYIGEAFKGIIQDQPRMKWMTVDEFREDIVELGRRMSEQYPLIERTINDIAEYDHYTKTMHIRERMIEARYNDITCWAEIYIMKGTEEEKQLMQEIFTKVGGALTRGERESETSIRGEERGI